MTRVWLLFLVLICTPVSARVVEVPPPDGRVTDLTGTLPAPVEADLEARLADLEQRKGSQLAVLVLPTTGDEAVEQYALRVAEVWKLGRETVDDGVLLLVAKDDRKLRVEVGYGLEGAIPDAIAKRVIDEIIVPRFRTDDYPGGIVSGVERLIGLIDGEALPEPQPAVNTDGDPVGTLVLAALFVVIVGGILRGLLGPFLGASVSGGLAFGGAWLLYGSLITAAIAAFAVFILVLINLFGHLASARGGGGGWHSGGGGGWSSGGGGGFSGGGGGFGGGGASGGW